MRCTIPSYVVSNLSGGDLIYSGGWLSGHVPFLSDAVQLRASKSNSGNIYIALSGGFTINSGQQIGSGGAASGLLDGMQLGPGDAYSIPKGAMPNSGIVNIFCQGDVTGSGRDRLYLELF